MTPAIRASVVAFSLGIAMTCGVWSVSAQNGKNGEEKHPVLRHSIQQLERIKDHLQQAPTDFGGHKAAAIEAIDHAMGELHQAMEFDKK